MLEINFSSLAQGLQELSNGQEVWVKGITPPNKWARLVGPWRKGHNCHWRWSQKKLSQAIQPSSAGWVEKPLEGFDGHGFGLLCHDYFAFVQCADLAMQPLDVFGDFHGSEGKTRQLGREGLATS